MRIGDTPSEENAYLDDIPNEHCEDGTSLASYEIECVIGYGFFGLAFRLNKIVNGTDIKCSSIVKIQKKPEIKDTNNNNFRLHLMENELEVIRSIHHPFLLSSECVYQDSKFIYMFNEPMIPFQAFLEAKSVFNVEELQFYIAELILAVEHLHSKGIAHLDILIKNLLLDNDGHIVLTDYGIANIKASDHIYQNSPNWYWYNGFSYSKQLNVDFGQIGVILTNMIQAYKGIEKSDQNYNCKSFNNYKAKLKQARLYQIMSRKLKKEMEVVDGVYLTGMYAPNDMNPIKKGYTSYTQDGLILPESLMAIFDIFERHRVESLYIPTEKTVEKYFALLKNASLFSDINWQSVYKRKLQPPFNGDAIRNIIVRKYNSVNNRGVSGMETHKKVWVDTIRQMYNLTFQLKSCKYRNKGFDSICRLNKSY